MVGRPKVSGPRSGQLNLSFTVSELRNIERRANALGMRAAHFGRMVLLDDNKCHPKVRPHNPLPVTGVIHHFIAARE
jgi:hypothetical protein